MFRRARDVEGNTAGTGEHASVVVPPLGVLLTTTQLQRFELPGPYVHHLLFYLQHAANEQQG